MTRSRKTLLALAIVLPLITLVTAGWILWSVLRPVKTRPFNDQDLQPISLEVPENANGLILLQEATEKLYWPKDREEEIGNLSKPDGWNAQLAQELLQTNAEVLQLFQQAISKQAIQIPVVKDFGEDSPYLSQWKRLAQLAGIQCRSLVLEKKPLEASHSALQVIHFGGLVENSGGPLVHYLVGASIKEIGLKQVRSMSSDSNVNAMICHSLIEKLGAYCVNASALSNTFKVEYHLEKNEVLNTWRSAMSSGTQRKGFFSSRIINMNETAELFAGLCRNGLTNIVHPWKNMSLTEIRPATNSTMQLMLKGNAMGRITADMMAPGWESALRRKCAENNSVSATRLLLALRCFQDENGSLPPTLQELIPKYLDRIPIDDFDGKPFRYSREKKIVYSVGEDLIDSGGEKSDRKRNRGDDIFSIEF